MLSQLFFNKGATTLSAWKFNGLGMTSSYMGFTSRTKRNIVPKILKKPIFTRKGMVLRPKKKDYQHDFSSPYIQNRDLYYDRKVDEELEKKAALALRKAKARFPEATSTSARPYDELITELQDEKLLNSLNPRLMVNLLNLKNFHQDKHADASHIVANVLKKLVRNAQKFNVKEFSILTLLTSTFQPENKELWRILCNVFSGYVTGKHLHKEELLANADESLQELLVHTLNTLLKQAKLLGLDTAKLSQEMEGEVRSHLGKISSISRKILLVTSLGKDIENPTPLYTLLKKDLQPNVFKSINLNDAISLVSFIAKRGIIDKEIVDLSVQRFIDIANASETKDSVTLGNVAVISQCLANLKHRHEKFVAFAEKFVKTQNIDNLKNACFLADSFSKLEIPDPELFRKVQQIVMANPKAVKLDQLKQLLSSTRKNAFYTEDFLKKLYEILQAKLARSDRPITAKDASFFIKHLRGLGTRVQRDTTELYEILNRVSNPTTTTASTKTL